MRRAPCLRLWTRTAARRREFPSQPPLVIPRSFSLSLSSPGLQRGEKKSSREVSGRSLGGLRIVVPLTSLLIPLYLSDSLFIFISLCSLSRTSLSLCTRILAHTHTQTHCTRTHTHTHTPIHVHTRTHTHTGVWTCCAL